MLLLLSDTKASIQSLAFSPDGSSLAVAGKGFVGVGLFDLATGKLRLRYSSHASHVTALAFSPDGDVLASTDQLGGVRLWQVADGAERASFTTWPHGGVSVAFSPDGKVLAASSVSWWHAAAQIRRWEVATGRELDSLRGHARQITSIAFSPDGATMATGSRDRSIHIWDARAGLERRRIASRVADFFRALGRRPPEEAKTSLVTFDTEIRALTFSPDGRVLAAATGWRATLWEASTGRLLTTLKGHRAMVEKVAWSPTGRILGTAGRDGVAKLWNVSQLTARAEHADAPLRLDLHASFEWGIGKLYSLAFAPDGLSIAAGGDGKVVLWDIDV